MGASRPYGDIGSFRRYYNWSVVWDLLMQKSISAVPWFEAAKARVSCHLRVWLSKPLRAILLLAVLVGMICLVVIPAWWHYDEPGHFEYAWLAAHSPTWPVPGQYSEALRRQMAVSMIQVGWYRIRNFKVDLKSNAPIVIGVPQVGDEPGYYFLASLPLHLMSNASITAQYYAARLVSLCLFLLIIVAVWYAAGEFLTENRTLRWMVTVFVALLPAFADTMISVNNDVGAVLAASLFFWASLGLIQRGYSLRSVLLLAASLVACYLSKNTAWFCFVLTPLVLFLAWLHGRFARFVWIALAIVLAGVALLTVKGGGPRAWYQPTIGDSPVRVQTGTAPVGKYAFQLSNLGAGEVGQIAQIVPPDQVKQLRGKTVTLGAWLWADHPTQAGPFFLTIWRQSGDAQNSPQLSTAATTTPVFHEIAFTVPNDAANAIAYVVQAPQDQSRNNIYFDGLILAEGEFGQSVPQFTDANGTQGLWGGRKFGNILRNASAEEGSIQVRKWVADKAGGVLTRSGVNLSLILTTAQDWRGASWYYQNAAATLFRTFWASLAGDKAFLSSSYVNFFLVVLTIGGVIGAGIRLWRRRRIQRWDILCLLGLGLVMPWLLAVARGNSDLLQRDSLVPWARYAYPAIFPTALLLCAGWLEWLEVLPGATRLDQGTRKAIFFSIMAGISSFAFMNAIQVFHPGWWLGWVSLLLLFLFIYAIFRSIVGWETRLGLEQPPSGGAGTA